MSFTNQSIYSLQNLQNTGQNTGQDIGSFYLNQTMNLLNTQYTLTATGWMLGLVFAGFFALFVGYFTLCFCLYTHARVNSEWVDLVDELNETNGILCSELNHQPKRWLKTVSNTIFSDIETLRANLAIGLQLVAEFIVNFEDFSTTEVQLLENLVDHYTQTLPLLKGNQEFYNRYMEILNRKLREVSVESVQKTNRSSSKIKST